jgi:glycosyltransferase involved in cell wall biosynthesis
MKVSICMITYNHEKYIHQAIEGILAQRCTFDWELIISDDLSCDQTRNICLEYQKQNPDKIKLLLPDKNLGIIPNFITTLKTCSADYVAICEGDDYWTDSLKLQKQVDFLENNPDYAICFTQAKVYNEYSGQFTKVLKPKQNQDTFTLTDIIQNNMIPTLTVVFRNGLFGNFPSWFSTLKYGDWPLHILNAQFGKIAYVPEITGVYRMHGNGAAGGVFKNPKLYIRNVVELIRVYNTINLYFNYKYCKIIRWRILNNLILLLKLELKTFNIVGSFHCFRDIAFLFFNSNYKIQLKKYDSKVL